MDDGECRRLSLEDDMINQPLPLGNIMLLVKFTPKPYFNTCTRPACMRIAGTIERTKEIRVPLRCRSVRFTDWLYAVNMDLLTLTLHTST